MAIAGFLPPEVEATVMARDQSPAMRLGVWLGEHYPAFDDMDRLLVDMYEDGLIDMNVYQKVLSHNFSYRKWMPAHSLPALRALFAEAKNVAPLMAITGQSIGAQEKNGRIMPILRENVPGMDSDTMEDKFREPLVRQQLTFEDGLKLLQIAQHKAVREGKVEREDAKLLDAINILIPELRRRGIGADVDAPIQDAPLDTAAAPVPPKQVQRQPLVSLRPRPKVASYFRALAATEEMKRRTAAVPDAVLRGIEALKVVRRR